MSRVINHGTTIPEYETLSALNAHRHVTNKWSNVHPIPPVGTKVIVTMNRLGPGTIDGYFVEDGYVGVYVILHEPPAWWVKQNISTPGRRAMLFGAEIKY